MHLAHIECCNRGGITLECAALLVRGGAVWQLVGLITRRSQVQILPPLPLHSPYLLQRRSPTRISLAGLDLSNDSQFTGSNPAPNYAREEGIDRSHAIHVG